MNRVCNTCNGEGVVRGLHNWTTGGKREEPCWGCRPAGRDALPIDMILHCPKCHLQHVDAPDATRKCMWCGATVGEDDDCPRPATTCDHVVPWTNPPHHKHLCAGCGHLWTPANINTNGVQELS